jgi:hypothetical protein
VRKDTEKFEHVQEKLEIFDLKGDFLCARLSVFSRWDKTMHTEQRRVVVSF